jgi:predicted dehydrogenase
LISRRAALAGLAAAGPARPAGKPVSVGIVAQRGVNVVPYLKGLSMPGLDRIGVSEESGELFQYTERYLGPRNKDLRTFRSHREMLREIRPELVVVTMEAYRAPEQIQAALEAGSHVIVEKPGCTSLAQFDALVTLADARGRQVMLALATRLHSGARKARDLVRTGAIGKPYGATMNWVGDQTRLKRKAYQESWFSFKAKAGGGKLLVHGIHYLDLIEFLTGDHIAKVTAFCRNVGGQPIEVEDAAVVSMLFRGGWPATLNTGYYLDKGFDNLIHLWGSDGWIRFDPLHSLQWYSTRPGAPKQVQTMPYVDEDLYVLMFRNAVAAAQGLEPPFVTSRESRAALNAVFTSYRANETGVTQDVA